MKESSQKQAECAISPDKLKTMLNKMRPSERFGISGLLLDWLKSYLKERQQYTAVNGSTSEMIPISFGIPQGSVLGPTLFTLFTNDRPDLSICLPTTQRFTA